LRRQIFIAIIQIKCGVSKILILRESMKKLPPKLVLLILIFPLAIHAQSGFQVTFGGPDAEQGFSVQQIWDSGYYVVGYTESIGAGSGDVNLIRTDSLGTALWTRTYGGTSMDIGYQAQNTFEGKYIIAGLTYSFGAGSGDVYLIRTEANGDTLWTRTFGGADLDWGYSVQQTEDHGFIVAGSTSSFGAGMDDFYLIKTDSTGETIWEKTYGGAQNDQGRSVWQTWPDGGYILAGSTSSYGSGESDVYLIKTDSLGNLVWSRTYGDVGSDHGLFVQQTSPDGGYIVAGDKYSAYTGGRDIFLIKTDTSGDTLWTKTFGGPGIDAGSAVRATTDGGYIVTGYTESYGYGGRDVYLIKTDSAGQVLWAENYGGRDHDVGSSIWLTFDGGYIITGYTESSGAGDRDVFLIKTDANGVVGIGSADNDSPGVPRFSSLSQNYPNPFNPSTTIAFDIPGIPGMTQQVGLTVYDLRGRRVRSLISSRLETGSHITTWDGRDDKGGNVPSGIYIYTLKTGDGTLSRKMTILK
jgi:hypothetical protein